MRGARFALLVLLVLSACARPSGPAVSNVPPTHPEMGGGASDVGSAGENRPSDHLAAWFVGQNKTIQACVEVAPDFGVSATEARAAILEAFAQWKAYIESHHIHYRRHFYDYEPGPLTLATRIALADHCSSGAELKFYLGVENDEVAGARRQFFNPTAFVQRQTFDRSIPLGKGFIWISRQASLRPGRDFFPNWQREGRLLAILLHEIGHVYGNDHIAGTIMAADISEKLDSQLRGPVLAHIDHCRELAVCRSCNYLSDVTTTGSWEEGRNDFIRAASRFPLRNRYFISLHRSDELTFPVLSLSSGGDWESYLLDVIGGVRPSQGESGLRSFKVTKGELTESYPDLSFVRYYSVERNVDFKTVGTMAVEYNLSACDAGSEYQQVWRSPVEAIVQARDRYWRLSPFSYLYAQPDANIHLLKPLEAILELVEPSPQIIDGRHSLIYLPARW